jgi:hypothetical protein
MRKISPKVYIYLLAALLLASCNAGVITEPTPTEVPTQTPIPTNTPLPTPTYTPTEIPTPTVIPGTLITGRVYMADTNAPVKTHLYLEMDDEDRTDITSFRTDDDGYYSYVIEEPGTYYINVSVLSLVNSCSNLSIDPADGWSEMFEHYYGDILVELSVNPPPITAIIGEEITLNCRIYCD